MRAGDLVPWRVVPVDPHRVHANPVRGFYVARAVGAVAVPELERQRDGPRSRHRPRRRRRRRGVPHQRDLNRRVRVEVRAAVRAHRGELDVSQLALAGGFVVGPDARARARARDERGGVVEPRVLHDASGDLDEVVRAAGEEPERELLAPGGVLVRDHARGESRPGAPPADVARGAIEGGVVAPREVLARPSQLGEVVEVG